MTTMTSTIEIIRNPNTTYAIFDGNKLVDDGFKKLEDAQNRAARYEAAKSLGSASTPAKSAAARANGAKGGRPRKDPEGFTAAMRRAMEREEYWAARRNEATTERELNHAREMELRAARAYAAAVESAK